MVKPLRDTIKTTANTGLAKVAILCSADTFVVNQNWFSASTFVVKIATFAKPENVVCHLKRHYTLGRKSNRKKQRIDVQKAIEKDHNRQKLIAYLILFPGVALFIWGSLLFEKTFIPTQTQVVIILLGAALGILGLHFLWRQKKYGLLSTLFFGFALGGPIPFTFIATTNYYLRTEKSVNIELDIIETGNHSRRKSRCRTPYAVVEHLDINKEILFPCDYETTISKYKTLTLTVAKGFWGYSVFIDKKLND